MSAIRNLLLIAATALAAMALMASSAFAQSIEVEDEATGNHCGDVVETGHAISDGCEVHATSEDSWVAVLHINPTTEVTTLVCQMDLALNISEDGTGYFPVTDGSILTNEATGCVITPCDEATGDPHPELEWPISGLFEYGSGREAMVVTFCVRLHSNEEGEGNTPCTVIIDITQTGHGQEFTAADAPCFEGNGSELTGHWVTDDEQDEIILHHIHYPTD